MQNQHSAHRSPYNQCFLSGGCNISIQHGDSSSVYLDGVSCWMCDRRRLALVVGLTFLLVQWWTRKGHFLMIVFTPLSSQPRPVYFWICNVGIQGGDATISIRASRLDWCDRLAVRGNGGTHTRRHLKLALTLLASQSVFRLWWMQYQHSAWRLVICIS